MARRTVQILKGTRDFLPYQFIRRRRIIEVIQETFEQFGFEPMETPAIEYAETLEEKYGEEGDRLIYKFTDQGGRRVALRYDLTVPLARAVAMYPVERIFRRYQISPVWRADRPQKGRFREFWQCDADIVGSKEMWADAEVIALTYVTLKKLGFEEFTIRINNRKLLNGIAIYGGIDEEHMASFFRVIDKAEKIGWDGVRKELKDKSFPESVVQKTVGIISQEAKRDGNLEKLKVILKDIPAALEGIMELEEINNCLHILKENRLIENIRDLLLELGYGFSFIGNQYRLKLNQKEYAIDLLFYHRILKCLVAIELKTVEFEPEFAGKMNFYLELLDEQEKQPDDNPSIGIILCPTKDNIEVEYALRTSNKPIGVAEYKLTHKLPERLKGKVPTSKELKQMLIQAIRNAGERNK